MDILIPFIVITVIILFSIRKFKPAIWVKITSILKK
mgnify:CR=1 FL=1|jgi:hypothetical protein